MRRISLAFALSAVLLAASASPAGAVTIGETFTPTAFCGAGLTRIQTTFPGSQYVVPSTGGIVNWTFTSWSFQADAAPPQLKFKVARAAPGADLTTAANLTIIGESGVVTPTANTLNTFPVQIPVKPGDLIGTYTQTGGNCRRTQSGYSFLFNPTDVPPGTSATFNPTANPTPQLDVSAVVTPTNTFTLGAIARNKKKGTATITATVPNPGELTAAGKGFKVTAATISKAVGAGTAQLKIRAKGKKKATLNEAGKVKVKPKISFTPTGGTASTQTRKLKLKKNL
jgi:hypothetical protein